ncbi:hypothetical protein [Quadrisphaera sp. KR29]|uniref:hypothetical protein n=1 Tax=Quadrisphaera sp. KR29 TaxID=3461391 RepID=UPI004043BB54
MSPEPRRRTSKRTARRPSAQSAPPRIPRQRTGDEEDGPPQVFVDDDDAEFVLHQAAEDPDFQEFLEQLPLVHMVGEYLDWVGDGVSPTDLADDEHDLVVELERRVGVELMAASGIGRRRVQVLSVACNRVGLTAIVGERLEPGPDVARWTEEDPVLRARVRGRVAAAVLEGTVRWLAAEHVLGDCVRHTFAGMLTTVGEGQSWPLGLASATRPHDLVAEHVDRIITEHVVELQDLGLCAAGGFLAAAPGGGSVLRSVAVGLRAAPVPEAPV